MGDLLKLAGKRHACDLLIATEMSANGTGRTTALVDLRLSLTGQ
jgi:hypothetical protein